jgi:hypothetical protein
MTALDVVAYLMLPVGGLVAGLVVYWVASRPEHPRPPAE